VRAFGGGRNFEKRRLNLTYTNLVGFGENWDSRLVPNLQFGEIRRFGNPESKQVGRIWDFKFVLSLEIGQFNGLAFGSKHNGG
jgi:hypothetical protein